MCAAAMAWGVSRSTAARWIVKGRAPVIPDGGEERP